MIDKALLAKIKKCLALARSANEHEAAAALAKARALMDAHGIDDATLALADIQEAAARASRNLRPPRWEGILAATVCRAVGVIQFIDERGDRCFIGRGHLPEIATYAFAVLFRQLKSARAEYIAKQLRRCKPGRKRQRADVFCEGWASAVLRKIIQLVPEPEEDEALGGYLAVQYPNLVTVNTRAAKMTRATDDYWRGRARGHKVNLHAGIDAGPAPLAIGQ